MQKREQGKSAASDAGAPAPKRGRPLGSGTNSSAAAAASAEAAAPASLLGPTLQVHSAFADQNHKRIVLALQSGLKSELTWALNALNLLSFKEKDEVRKDATPLAKVPGLLDALLQVIDDWRDIALPKDISKTRRARILGVNAGVTGFGNEYEALSLNGHPSKSNAATVTDALAQKGATKHRPEDWWYDEDGLFNLDEEGRAEKQQCAVAASNIVRNFSFMGENEIIMAQNRHCVETVFQCIEDHGTEDEELVTNVLEILVNLAPLLDLRIFSSPKPSFINFTENRAVQAIIAMLESSVKVWHCSAAEIIGRMVINPDNEPFLLLFASQIYKRLVDLLSLPALDAQAAAVGALYNLAEVNTDCRLKLASERWAVDRLLKIVKAPHPVHDICRKAAMILENLVSEPQNRVHLLAYENAFAEVLISESKQSDSFARILYEMTSRPSSKLGMTRAVWGM
ncbi:hypothetical protein Droror1_Dr00000846 [Drosera rotundifolia]